MLMHTQVPTMEASMACVEMNWMAKLVRAMNTIFPAIWSTHDTDLCIHVFWFHHVGHKYCIFVWLGRGLAQSFFGVLFYVMPWAISGSSL